MSTLKRNVIANYAGKAWAAIINVAFVPLYINYMGIEAYGLVGIFATIQPLMTILDLGLSPSINRELARYSASPGQEQMMRNSVRTLEVVYWGLAAVLCGVVLLLSPVVAAKWVNAQALSFGVVKQSVLLMGLSMVFQWPVGFYSGGLMGLQRQVLFNYINAALWTLRGVGALVVVIFSPSPVLAFFWWQLFMSIVNVAAVGVALWRSLPATGAASRFQYELIRSVWRLAIGMSLVSVVILLFNQLDKIILSKQISLTEFGYYSIAWQVVGSLFMLYYPIYCAFFPVLTQLQAKNDVASLTEVYHKGCQFMSLAVMPISATLVFFSKEILFLWIRDPVTVAHCHVIMSVLIVGATFNGLLYMPYSIMQAFGRMKVILYIFIPFLVIYVPLLMLSAKHYGLLGAAATFSGVSLLQDLIVITLIHRCIIPGENLNWFTYDLFYPLVSSFLLCGGLKLLITWPITGLVGIATIASCFCATLAFTALATPITFRYLKQYVVADA
ncbi:oligosaccharide flippase family protein [Geomonas nitrogeniifigens]|uniref:lipopolysaccharide biosynthesis protein n=1 Tax=Geomonas diazotrophica TaxID=2843197 RepID=UPI001C2BBDB6|nr:oligosaccharide flippase family protein [Geomonas nitrogeniifigens]QXE85034.1 oligosaccharide flippase family protein [Geomonas nitrogeniifigens]